MEYVDRYGFVTCPVCNSKSCLRYADVQHHYCTNCASDSFFEYKTLYKLEVPIKHNTSALGIYELIINFKNKTLNIISYNNFNLNLNWIESNIDDIIYIADKKLKKYIVFM